jgi:hypothetical protein
MQSVVILFFSVILDDFSSELSMVIVMTNNAKFLLLLLLLLFLVFHEFHERVYHVHCVERCLAVVYHSHVSQAKLLFAAAVVTAAGIPIVRKISLEGLALAVYIYVQKVVS